MSDQDGGYTGYWDYDRDWNAMYHEYRNDGFDPDLAAELTEAFMSSQAQEDGGWDDHDTYLGN